MSAGWRAGFVFLFMLGGCSSTPAATPSPVATQPVITEPRPTEPPASEVIEPTPTAADSGSGDHLSDGNGWPVDVSATLSGTFNDSDGSYSATGEARWCGVAFYSVMLNPRAFFFEFPLDDATGNITDVTFSADDLVPGASTTTFHISVSVHTGAGFDPAATVVDPGTTGIASSGTGSAQLAADASTRTLQLEASTNDGETIKLKGICSAP